MPSDEAKRPGTRKKSPKTRSGCGTCKIRRVKCGEEKPNCLRCVRFGCTCDGYGHLSRPTPPNLNFVRRILPSVIVSRQIDKIPSASLFRDEKESRYFENFCSKTSYEILPTFNSGPLRQMLLQAAHDERSIRHAVVALGALDVTTEHIPDFKSLDRPVRRSDHSRHHLDALEQYTVAIKHMQNAASSARKELRTALLECLVTLCFEAWNGNYRFAVMQVQTGIKLIHFRRMEILASRTKIPDASLLKTIGIMEEDFVRTFTGLDIYTICEPLPINFLKILEREPEGLSSTNPAELELEEREILSRIPAAFTSIHDAQTFRNALRLRVLRFISSYAPIPKPPADFVINGWWGEVSSTARAVMQSIFADIIRWKASFEPLWERLKFSGQSTRLPAAMLSLQIRTMCMVLLVPCIEDEAKFDEYTNDFMEITNLVEDVLVNGNSRRYSFLLDTNVVFPLLVTAQKCRDRSIRRKAIYLMFKYPRREGVWDSFVCGKLAEWVMDLEEQYLDEGLVPSWARIRGVILNCESSPDLVITCVQRISEESEKVVTRNRLISECGSISSLKTL